MQPSSSFGWATEHTPIKGPADRFTPRQKCNDPVPAALMVVHLVAVVAIARADLPTFKVDTSDKSTPHFSATGVAVTLVPALLTGAASIALALWLMRKRTRLMFNTMFAASLTLLGINICVLAVSATISGVALAIILVAVLLIHVFFWYVVQRHIHFAGACIETAIHFLRRHPATLSLGLASLLPALGWTALVALCLCSVAQQLEDAPAADESSLKAKQLFLAFSLYWTWQFISNGVHAAVAGAFASWYFHGTRAQSVVVGSLRRTFTSSFGSVCFGSLLVAVLQLLRMLARGGADGRGSTNCVADLVLSCIESLLRFFNKYAFCYVAIYGQPFTTAGRSVFALFEHKGLTTLLNDDVTSIVLAMCVLIGGALGTIVTGLAALVLLGTDSALACAIGGAIVSGGMVYLVLSAIDSCVATLFVCFAEDPAALNVTAPEAFAALSVAWAQRYPHFSQAHVHGTF